MATNTGCWPCSRNDKGSASRKSRSVSRSATASRVFTARGNTCICCWMCSPSSSWCVSQRSRCAQRLLCETHQEEDGEHIQQQMHVFPRAVNTLEAVALRLTDLDFRDAEPLSLREHGQQPVLVAIE